MLTRQKVNRHYQYVWKFSLSQWTVLHFFQLQFFHLSFPHFLYCNSFRILFFLCVCMYLAECLLSHFPNIEWRRPQGHPMKWGRATGLSPLRPLPISSSFHYVILGDSPKEHPIPHVLRKSSGGFNRVWNCVWDRIMQKLRWIRVAAYATNEHNLGAKGKRIICSF